MIYELEVTLNVSSAPVRRTLELDGRTTFYELHQLLQTVFAWDNDHLHNFLVYRMNGKRPEKMEMIGSSDEHHDEQEEIVADWFRLAKDYITYVYDLGDNWRHDIALVKKRQPQASVTYPRCINAESHAPAEDADDEASRNDANRALPLVAEINEAIHSRLSALLRSGEDMPEDGNQWPEVLATAKQFQKLKPWKVMTDEHTFAVIDPVTSEWLYCSVIGYAGEMYGLVVYIGDEGFASLMDTLKRGEPDFGFIVHQRGMLLSFEDRQDLEKEEYQLIKSYDVAFRGRKSWPSFTSYKPGLYPWFIDDEEARLLLLGLEQTIAVYQDIKNGMKIPDIILNETILVKVPYKQDNAFVFSTQTVDLQEPKHIEEAPAVPLAISELELKRMEKLKTILPVTIEFSMEYMDMPVQKEAGDRPVFPLLALAVDETQGMAVYYNLLTEEPDASVLQREFLRLLDSLDGIPEQVMVKQGTADVLKPLTDKLHLSVDVADDLPFIQNVLEMMADDLPSY